MAERTTGETCSVVDQHCEAPANGEARIQTECFACAQPACRKCSSIRRYYHYGLKRLCNSCQTDYDGSPDRVLLRIHHQAGYPKARLKEMAAVSASTGRVVVATHRPS